MVSFSLVPNVWKVFFPNKTEVTSNNIFMIYNKGSPAPQKRMNFQKSSKRPLIPPLIFGKSYCKLIPEFMTKILL